MQDFSELNDDEKFYRNYFNAGKNAADLKEFLRHIDIQDATRRHLVIPELLPDAISYQMNDEEYFPAGSARNVFISPHNRYTPAFMHRHEFFEIAYVYSGNCTQNIGMNRIHFSRGDMIFIAPGIYHTMEVFDDESIIFNILLRKGTFHRMFLAMSEGKNIQGQFFREGLYDSHRLEYLVFHTGESRQEFMRALYREHLANDEYTGQILTGMIISMSAEIMRDFGGTMECSYLRGNVKNDEGFAVLGYIQEHYGSVSFQDIAGHFGFSVPHCSRLIRKTTGMSFNDWKRTLRIRRAENMLINTLKTVNEISLSLGYENTETFIRLFRKELHVAPGEYRRIILRHVDKNGG